MSKGAYMFSLLLKLINLFKSSLSPLTLFFIFFLSSTLAWSATDLSITQTVSNNSPIIGETVTFTLTGRNNGPDASRISITDTLPVNFGGTFTVNENSINFTCSRSGQVINCSGTRSFATNETVTVTITATVLSVGSPQNTASISSFNSIADNNLTNNTASQSFTIPVPSADLSITKTANTTIPNLGDTVTFTLIGRNNGPTTTDIQIVDDLPSSLQWISDTDNGKGNFDCTNVGNQVTCTGSEDFSTNETVTINIQARVIAQGSITNTANIASTTSVFDNVTSNNTASVVLNVPAPTADLSITKTANTTTPSVGSNVVFTITGRNNGPVASTMTITDALPLGLTWVSDADNSANFDCTNIGNAVTCTGTRSFLSGESATVTLTALTASEGNITNTATIASAGGIPDPNTGNNSASASLNAQPNYGVDNLRAFTLFRQDNINGDMQIIGNSVKLATGGVCPPLATNNNRLLS